MKQIEDHFGIQWLHHGVGTDDHLALGGHEPAYVAMCRSVLRRGGVFVDVGAHVGLYSLRLADKAGEVWAVEANPRTYESLVENLRLNPELSKKVHAIQRAAWDVDDEVLGLVDANGIETGGSTRVVQEQTALSTKTIRLDSLLKEAGRIAFIKIDVEGAERNVLDGAVEVLATSRPWLFIEMHDFMRGPENRVEIQTRLDAAGYVHGVDFPAGGDPLAYHWLCQPKEDA